MDCYCNVCGETIINKPRNKHNKTRSHYFMKNYVTNNYNYNDIVWVDVENILHENIISHDNKFNEFKTCVSCKMKDDVEINVNKNACDMSVVLPTWIEPFKTLYEVGTLSEVGALYVQFAGKMINKTICENLRSKYGINCTPDMKIRNLTTKFISRYNNMTYRYQLEQPTPMIESKMVKHIKNMSEEEQDNYNFLVCKHKNC